MWLIWFGIFCVGVILYCILVVVFGFVFGWCSMMYLYDFAWGYYNTAPCFGLGF